MKSLFKVLLGIFGTIIVLVIALAIALPLIYDTEDLKVVMADQVNKQTGRELRIGGDLKFSVFPWLAVEVYDLELGNAAGFGDQPFARIEEARMGVALVPLLRRQIAVDTVTLVGLDLALAVDSNGKNNWSDLGGNVETGSDSQSAQRSRITDRRIAGLDLRNARVRLVDESSGSDFRIGELSLQTGPVGDGQPVSVDSNALLEDLIAGTAYRVSMSGIAALDPDSRQVDISDLQIGIEPGEAGSSGSALRLEAPNLSADLAGELLKIETFRLMLADLDASGRISVQEWSGNLNANGEIRSGTFSPAAVMQALGAEKPETTDPQALQSAQFATSFSATDNSLEMPDFRLALDQSSVEGQVTVREFDRPRIRFDLNIDEIDVDRYLAPASDENAPEAVDLPNQELKDQQVNGSLTIGTLVMSGVRFTDANVGLTVQGGTLRLNPLTAAFYGGRYEGDITLDSSGAKPVLSLNETIDSITLQNLVADLVDSESLSGLAKGHIRLTGTGDTSLEVLGSLQGDLSLDLSDGALEGINVWHEIRKGMARYKGLEMPAPEPNRTVFSRMQFNAAVDRGIADTRQLIVELPFLTLDGNGAINLGQSSLDMQLVAAVRNVPELANDPLTAELSGRRLPFRITGPFDNPAFALDFESLLKSEATNLLLDKLGLAPSDDGESSTDRTPADSTEGESPAESDSSGKTTEEAAVNTLFQLLQGASEKEKQEENPDKEGDQ